MKTIMRIVSKTKILTILITGILGLIPLSLVSAEDTFWFNATVQETIAQVRNNTFDLNTIVVLNLMTTRVTLDKNTADFYADIEAVEAYWSGKSSLRHIPIRLVAQGKQFQDIVLTVSEDKPGTIAPNRAVYVAAKFKEFDQSGLPVFNLISIRFDR